MTYDEFMATTPRYFDQLVKQYYQTVEREERGRDMMFAQLIAMVANTGFRGWKEPRQPSEWLQHWEKPKPKRKRSAKQITEEVRKTMLRMMALHGAKIVKQ